MSEIVVSKFGGSSVANATQFKKIKDIVASDSRRKVIVVSAPGKEHKEDIKVTDLLFSSYELATKNLDISPAFTPIVKRFSSIAHELGLSKNILTDLDTLKDQLINKTESITEAFVISRGEYLCARLMAEFLGGTFIDAFDVIEIDIHGRANEHSFHLINEKLSDDAIHVVPGFYGKGHHGNLETFSRGGSDISGAILANGLNAALYENWTDVSGLLMADPRLIDSPKPMKNVSYREIRELAYMGANVFHDEAIAPCKNKDIRISIKNTNRPEDLGTIIGPVPDKPKHTITGIAGKKDFSLIYIEKSMMNKERGFGRKVLGILESHNVAYEHSPTGIDSMSVIVDQAQLNEVEELVLEDIKRMTEPDTVKVSKDLSLIATVGHGMSQNIGVSAQLFTALAKDDINIRIIDQGSSEINIIIGVEQIDYERSISAIYNAFIDRN